MTRHFINLLDHSTEELHKILDCAAELKAERKAGGRRQPLMDKNLSMIFEKPSTRTRVSFEVAIRELGGHALILQKYDLQLGRGETVADTARVLSRYIDAITLRCHSHSTLLELVEYSDVPVINALSDQFHPCQVMADVLTLQENLGDVTGKKIAWVGDGNNMCHTFMTAAHQLGFHLHIATPKEFAPRLVLTENGVIHFHETAEEAVKDADAVITDTWVSMGDDDTLTRKKVFQDFRVDEELMAYAKPEAVFLHCLPAHRGDEVTNEVLDGHQSVVFDEAENRLHVQKAILMWVFGLI